MRKLVYRPPRHETTDSAWPGVVVGVWCCHSGLWFEFVENEKGMVPEETVTA